MPTLLRLTHALFSSIFLFLFTGLLLHTDPDGIARNRIVFSALVGFLTTSIVGWTAILFLRDLWRQTVRALHGLDDDDDDDEEEDAEGGPPLDGVAEEDETGEDARCSQASVTITLGREPRVSLLRRTSASGAEVAMVSRPGGSLLPPPSRGALLAGQAAAGDLSGWR